MIAIREIKKIRSRSFRVDLPSDFHAEKVEIIILPVEEQGKGQNLTEILLKAPTLSREQCGNFKKIRGQMNAWPVQEF